MGPGPLRRNRLYEQVVHQVLTWAASSGLGPGDRLPAERELAASLGVSRATLAQALVALEVTGVVAVRHGDGTVLLTAPRPDSVLAALDARREDLGAVIEAREALEVRLAGLAARRRTDGDLAAIDAALAGMAADVGAGGRGVAGDEQFHAAVTAAGHSPLLARFMAEIADRIRDSRIESLSQEGRPHRSLEGHRAIADAIRAGDPDAAAAAMAAHIHLVSDVPLLGGG
ncbi:FadR/GntR family transcriptional regulator [Klenkia brasiliensis]|uniref:Regulatory protein, gntR family n=1 Tax=Klenkia brasiliensis TaxID=333142 RepID=A0A1G7LSQ4_9ACTN|nr:FCD domain-containing protein [Klenkia brasiliensis]SDF52473.1 regulatory protein, gntR family [Klenkia brasiliensis]